jgi:hypothetical protein
MALEMAENYSAYMIENGENYVCLQRGCEKCCELDLRVSDFIKQSEHFKVHHKLCRFIADFAVVPDFFVMKAGENYEI